MKFSVFGLAVIVSRSLYNFCCVSMFSKVFCRAALRACVFRSDLILFFVVNHFCKGFGRLSDFISFLITLESCVWWSMILYVFMLFFHGWFVL